MKDKKEQKNEQKEQQYQPSRFIKMRQQALLQQSEIPTFSSSQNLSQRSQSTETEKKKFKPTFSSGNLPNASAQLAQNLTSFEKKQLFPIPAAKSQKQKPERKKTSQQTFKQPQANVQITLGGYTSTEKMPSAVISTSVIETKKIELDEKQYLPPINFKENQIIDKEKLLLNNEEENLQEQLPPLAQKPSMTQNNKKIQFDNKLTLVQLPQKLPIKEQLDYYEKNKEKLQQQKIPDFIQSQENKQYLLKFLIKNSEQQQPQFTKLISNNYCKKCFNEKQKGVFKLGKVIEYESGKCEINIGGVNFIILQGAKQDFISEACVIQKPSLSENQKYQLIQLGEIENKLIIVPKFN